MSLKSTQIKSFNGVCEDQTLEFSENIKVIIFPVNNYFKNRPMKYGSYVNFKIENVKGDFDILKLEFLDANNTLISIPYDVNTKTFPTHCILKNQKFDLFIMAKADFQTVVSVTHRLQIPQARFQYLEPNQMFIDNIILSNSTTNAPFKFYGKKLDAENIEVHIENPVSTNVKLNGKKGDFHYASKLQDIDLMLSFIFELSEFDEQTFEECESRPPSISSDGAVEENAENVENALQKNPASQNLTIPEKENSPSESSEECQSNCKWYKMSKNQDSSDMIIITPDAKVLPLHHSYLTQHSTKFAKMFNDSEILPVIIKLDLQSQLLTAALDYLNRNNLEQLTDLIVNSQDQFRIFLFADEWNIPALMEAVPPKFEDHINPCNVCAALQAYFNKNCEETKKFCKTFILENKEKIDAAELGKLSSEVLSFIFSV